MRIENNIEQDPSHFRENQPFPLAAMTTNITSYKMYGSIVK
jgi:hypothetical protein